MIKETIKIINGNSSDGLNKKDEDFNENNCGKGGVGDKSKGGDGRIVIITKSGKKFIFDKDGEFSLD
jgi:hypothetical protein